MSMGGGAQALHKKGFLRLTNTEIGVVNPDIDPEGKGMFSIANLARLEQCQPAERCWFSLFGPKNDSMRFCTNCHEHGGLGDPRHQFKQATINYVMKTRHDKGVLPDHLWEAHKAPLKKRPYSGGWGGPSPKYGGSSW